MEDDKIIVESINNSFLHIDTTPAIMRELSDFFSFLTPNYMFMPKYKNGLWDGKTRLYKIMGSTLPAGLFEILLTFAADREYEVEDRRVPCIFESPTEGQIDTFLNDLNVHSGGDKIDHYDYQVESVKLALTNRRATILSATSSGKSLIIYSLIRYLEKSVKNKILIIVPTVTLVAQMFSDFNDYASEVDWRSEDNVHCITEGILKNDERKIYLSTWQSIYKMPKEYFEQFDVVLCDEVHGATGESITNIMEKSINAFIRIGFTGTLKSKYLHQLTIVGLFGDIKRVISTREMIDRGISTPFKAKFLILKYNDEIRKEINRKVVLGKGKGPKGKDLVRNNYVNEIDFITENLKRNIFIANLVSVLDGNVLVLFNKVEKHGKPLYNLIKKKLDKKKNVYYISGETKAGNRETIRGTIENETNGVLVASYGTLSTGVNIKSLKYVIFASPYKSEIKVLQSIGRILRKCSGKEIAVLFDIVDDLRWKSKKNYCFTHFERRFEMYKEEMFPVSISEYNLM